MEKRVAYFDELELRNKSLRTQRSARLQLALAMARPEARPDNLIEPDLSAYEREIPDYDDLLAQILLRSPRLKQKALQLAQLESLARQMAGDEPCLLLALPAVGATHKSGLSHAGTLLPGMRVNTIPIQRADLLALIEAKRAESMALNYRLRERVLTWVHKLEKLAQQIAQNAQNLEYRERALDKSRLLYEMEVQAQIGQAQADMARLLWQDAQAKYKRAVIWERIDAALGAPEVRFE